MRAKSDLAGNLLVLLSRASQQNAPDNDFKDHYAKQVARGKPKMKALFATMGKLAEIIYHCLKTGQLYQYQGRYRRGWRRPAGRIGNPAAALPRGGRVEP